MKIPGMLTLGTFVLLLSAAPPAFREDGLVAYYSFNHCDARDDSGNGSNGQLYGYTSCHCGIEEYGLLLDGRTAYIEFPGPVNKYFTTSDFSLSFYFRPMQFGPFPQNLLSKRSDCGEDLLLDLNFNSNYGLVETEFQEAKYKGYRDISPPTDTTTWLHFALVREGTWAYTYINGVLQKQERKCSGVDITNEAVLAFSHSPCIQDGKTIPFKGVIDELKVFGRALSQEEIAKLYALHPVESAEQDCLVFREEKILPGNQYPAQSAYLCAVH
ncbi:MAG: LamG domain-containing protein [Lewinellaceae bacterium]|nr:LamG domain-containing protein [Lewinellaceae bacterium]